MHSFKYQNLATGGAGCLTIDQKQYWEAQHQVRAKEHLDLEDTPNAFAVRCASLIPERCSVVEIGPGNGRDARYFVRSKGCTVLAIDIAENALHQLREAARRDNTVRRIKPLVSRVQDLTPRTVGTVDAYYARSSLHLSDAEFTTFLSLVEATLKPSGHLMIEGKSVDDFKIRRSTQIGDNLFADLDGHLRRAWSEDSIRAFVDRIGYSLIEINRSEETWGGQPTQFISCIAQKYPSYEASHFRNLRENRGWGA